MSSQRYTDPLKISENEEEAIKKGDRHMANMNSCVIDRDLGGQRENLEWNCCIMMWMDFSVVGFQPLS